MIHTRGTHSNDGEIVMTQLLQGIGGGFGTLAITVAAQASVPHADIAVTTAILILWSEVGSAVGAAVGESILSFSRRFLCSHLGLTRAYVLYKRARSGRTRCR